MRCEILSMLAGCTALLAAEPDAELIFREDFADLALPAWHGDREAIGTLSASRGADGGPALTIEATAPDTGTLSVDLPTARVAGRAVLLDLWRKADGVETGARHYLNAKAMVSFKARDATQPNYSTTLYSDFSGTFDWERHRYVVNMPADLEWARVSIGLQACTGKASWARLRVSLDPRFPDQAALDRFLAKQERDAYAKLDAASLTVKTLDGGIVQVFTGPRHVPRRYWNAAVRGKLLDAVPAMDTHEFADGQTHREQLARALAARTKALAAGVDGMTGHALNDRVCEIAGLRARVRQLASAGLAPATANLRAATGPSAPVNPLVFGNNINTQNLSAPYDSERGRFQDGFLARIRPMDITFLRYPGGCNADVFNWRDTIGPLAQRRDLINYHNGTSRGTPNFGVDEYLRFCEEEKMVPIITTAFLKDQPSKVDPNEHPKGIRHPFVFEYVKSAPERIRLAADWVEYCNGPVTTTLGRRRAENGHPAPYGVKYWEVGNESYGPDPVGSCSAEEYAAAFPDYVEAMKARDPGITVIMNGGPDSEWNETVLRHAGRHADAFQFHIYLMPRVGNYTKLEGQPHQVTAGMRLADSIPGRLRELEAQMRKHLGRTLPTIVSEFGMGNAKNREFMTSVTSPVLVADMWRHLIESPLILGANKWCLFTGYWFSQVQGPTLSNPTAPYYNRPEQIMHTIYARCRGAERLPVTNETSDGLKAVVFSRPDSYGVVVTSREAVSWQAVTLDLPGVVATTATCLLMTAGHPFLGNENDHDLVAPYEFSFDCRPGEPIFVPANSVMGLIIPRPTSR